MYASHADEEEVVALCGLYIEKDHNKNPKDWAAYKYPWKADVAIGVVPVILFFTVCSLLYIVYIYYTFCVVVY